MRSLTLMATLLPSFPFFARFASDARLGGIRLNSAMLTDVDLEVEFRRIEHPPPVPLWFDVKGRQLRVTESLPCTTGIDLRINHPISVQTPTVVLFKAGADHAVLDRVEEGGYRLRFLPGATHGPAYDIRVGESFHIRHPSLRVGGPQFTDTELEKIALARRSGFTRYFLSYVESQRDVDEFRALVGRDAAVMLKIENARGLQYVTREFRKDDRLTLVAARGDLYVEVEHPHDILPALQLIIEKDPEACVGSRILLSVIHEPVPSCADFTELAWLCDIGYRTMLLCDELCLKEPLVATAINAFEGFRQSYVARSATASPNGKANRPRRSFIRSFLGAR